MRSSGGTSLSWSMMARRTAAPRPMRERSITMQCSRRALRSTSTERRSIACSSVAPSTMLPEPTTERLMTPFSICADSAWSGLA